VIISDCLYTNWVEDSAAALAVTLHAALGRAADGTCLAKQVWKDGHWQGETT